MAEPLAVSRQTVERHWRDQILRRGWIALGRQSAYSSVGISVYAICANR